MAGNPSPKFVIMERRERVLKLISENMTEIEIAKDLCASHSTVCRDIKAIKKECQNGIQNIIEETLPYELEKSLQCMNLIIKECWNIQKDKSDKWTNKDKLNALKLIKDAESTRFEILMSGPVTLKAKQVCQKVKELTEENEVQHKSYFNLGPPPGGYGEL
jgi:hypothetical protein